MIDLAKRDNLTVRQLAQRVGGFSGLAFVGTAVTIADQMEEWFFTEACDGFNIMFPYLPGGLDDFVDQVVPNCKGADSFGANTRARPCARTWVCRGRRIGSSAIGREQ